MIKIRLMRIGAKKRPFYRVVVVDERAKRTGGYIELLGTYNPLTNPHEIRLKQDRVDHWIKMGAQMSDGYLRIIGKAKQRPPRKPKKQKSEVGDQKPENSENSATQNIGESEKSEGQTSDTSGTPSPSVPTESGYSSSEPSKEEPTK